MIFDSSLLILIGFTYLGLLFLIAHASEKGWLPLKLVKHPVIYTLSLGVFVSTWGLFGAVEFASSYGYNYLTFFLGFSGAFLLAPIIMQPILRLTKAHQLGSLADLLAFRFRSQSIGTLASITLLMGMMPILTMQIQTVATLSHLMTGQQHTIATGLVFCAVLVVFTLLFGTRTRYARQQSHDGLVVAVALESLIKLLAFVAVALYGYFYVLGGNQGIKLWLDHNPQALVNLYEPLKGNYWHSLLLVFFFAAVVMPTIYQLAFTENRSKRDLSFSSWALPLYLLIMALCIPIVLWAGDTITFPITREFHAFSLVLHSESEALGILLFLGTLAASSGILIVSTLALSNMLLNHVLLPLRGWGADDALYQKTVTQRRALIVCIPLAAFLLSWLPQVSPNSTEMSMLGFVAMLQLVPAVVALLFWPRATREGIITGLVIGVVIWLVTLLFPSFSMWELRQSLWQYGFNLVKLDHWQTMGLFATLANAIAMIVVSVLTNQTESDKELAASCSIDNLRSPLRWRMSVDSVQDFTAALRPVLGPITAEREVQLALTDLGLKTDELRPYALRRLRDQLGSNLSGLLGPSVAQDILDAHIPQLLQDKKGGDDIHYIESKLEDYRDKLSGLAAELDMLRRFHRQTLYDLPLGVCTLGHDLEVISWNHAMAMLTQQPDQEVIGSRLDSLPAPWNQLFSEFLQDQSVQWRRHPVTVAGETRWINLHRAVIGEADGNLVLVMEDVSAMQSMQSRLQHTERLAGIGRLAAGVAHEIGNPVTGIASLAQNLRADFPESASVTEYADSILEQTRRVTRIVQSLVSFSHTDQHVGHELEAVPLASVVAQAIELLKLAPAARFTHFANDIADDVMVHGDSQRLCQVFVNLLSNARDASPENGKILVRAECHGDRVQIEVEDFGHGLPPGALRDTLFEPFVTTKPAGTGTGLGLALVHGIIESHHGSIQMVDKGDYDQGQGVIVQLTLPLLHEEDNT
jgi:signal transduction histidine kinase/Na+/proline symporter